MTKKILSVIIMITILWTSIFGQAIFANNESSTDEIEVSNFDVAQVDVEKVSAVFLLSDLVNNPDSKWNNNCKIADVTALYDFDNNITAYSCQVVNGSIDSGYIVVSASSDLNPIIEFSYDSKSPSNYVKSTLANQTNESVDKVYFTGGLDYLAGFKDKNNNIINKDFNNKNIDKKDFKNSFKVKKDKRKGNNEAWGSIKKVNRNSINIMFSTNSSDNTSGGVISDLAAYLKNYLGTNNTFTRVANRTKLLNYVGNWLMTDYEKTGGIGSGTGSGVENCTLSSLSNILIYFSANGFSKVPLDRMSIYRTVRAEAVKLGFTTAAGICHTQNNNLVNAVWKAFGYADGSGSNDYVWTYTSIKSKIDVNRPVMLSMATGQYYDHTIAVRGYTSYSYAMAVYDFLVVPDNWNSGDRYISNSETKFGCATYIYSPTVK